MSLDALDALYKEVILDHYQNPRNNDSLESPSVATEGYNPVCGDQITLQLKMADGLIESVGLQGKGCAISQASASMMTEAIKGKTLEEAEATARRFRDFMTKGNDQPDSLGDLEVLEGVRMFPVRIKCATLGWNTLQEAIKEYRAGLRGGRLVIKEDENT
ncbi:MAG: SUF system NifU family Fe-S cluster assembly protein [Chloroflexi bacterium]|nr:SUF system NifU family Fe-S cluster assembly protein [Chloroflexota bacterium]